MHGAGVGIGAVAGAAIRRELARAGSTLSGTAGSTFSGGVGSTVAGAAGSALAAGSG
jgi:hypothetical protein